MSAQCPHPKPQKPVRATQYPRKRFERLSDPVAPIDRRTPAGRSVALLRTELIRHVGGAPTATQAALIGLACQLATRLAVMDCLFAENPNTTAHDSRSYLSWANSLTRTLARLGLDAAPVPVETLRDHLAKRRAE